MRPVTGTLCAILCLVGLARQAEAQYFGQNKVRYHDFDFRILETPHFDIYYYSSEQESARQAGVLAERWYEKLSKALGHELRRRQPLVLYASPADFVETNVVSGALAEGIAGVTEGARNRMALPFGLSLAETDHVIGHELVHAFQYDLARSGHPSIVTMPLWFVEGMAEFYSVPAPHNQTHMWMRDAVRAGRLPSVKDLGGSRYFPYRYGHALWLFIAERYGPDTVVRLLKSKSTKLAGKMKDVLGLTLPELTEAWHRALQARYSAPEAASPAGLPLRTLVGRRTGGKMNVGPALSPDGRRMAYVSEKDLFSIEVFLADVETGRTTRKILKRAADPHFDSLEFIDSAGAWDPGGQRFVVSAVRGGRPVLVIISADTGTMEREIPIASLGRICNPAWSPDGRLIAFTGSSGGWSDLYTYDLQANDLRRWTNDAFAELQPAWAPDGASIAFTTDRYSTRLASLEAGDCRLALLDVSTGRVRPLRGPATGRSIDPQWGDGGRSIYFIGDPDGVPNVYRLELASERVTQITSVPTGVTGITPMSPALSVAGSTLALSLYENGEYRIAKSEVPVDLDAAQPFPAIADVVDDPSPFVERATSSTVAEPTASASAAGTLGPVSFPVKPYRRRLTLEGIGDPYITAGGGALGSFLQAGTSVLFGDMLGDQQLGLAFQGGKRPEDFAARALYVNRRSRWNWGLSLDYVPAVFATSAGRLTPKRDGIAQDVVYEKQYHASLSALAFYPFNRSRRLEVSAGVRQIGFGREVDHQVISLATGKKLSHARESLPGEPGVTLAQAGAALVYDSAIFGGTSPILGRRYRFEVAPTFGSLTFTTLLADFRQYLVPLKPFTLAVRGRYMTRLGRDAGDPRLLPLVLTLRGEARGYDLRNVAQTACGDREGLECSLLGLLTRSSLTAGNVELRFPIPGAVKRSFNYGPLPMEGFLFVDAASLRTRNFTGGADWKGHLLRSAGAGVRLNGAGIVFEMAAARRYDGPGGWAFSFNLGPGF